MEKLLDKRVAVVGYGSQGHAHALNLMESGADVTVGLREGSANWRRAQDAGLKVASVENAVGGADIVMMLVPDEVQPEVYEKSVAPNLKEGAYLGFGHGFNIHYNKVKPKDDVNVFMVAPKGPGHMVRRTYTEGKGTPCLVAVHRDVTGDTKDVAMAWANGIGGKRAGILETTFKEETETDLFGEQAVLCGGVSELMRAGYETLVEAGYSPESAYFECVHEMKLIVDMVVEGGFTSMRSSISNTAEYGDYEVGKRIITEDTKMEMKRVLSEIQDGTFADKFCSEYRDGMKNLKSTRDEKSSHQMEVVGERLRRMMV